MSFPEGPPTGEPQQYATDGRDAESTNPTADSEASTSAALAAEDPSEGSTESGAAPAEGEPATDDAGSSAADWDSADRSTAVQQDSRGQRAAKPGGALGPGTTATGGGTSLD